MPLLHRYYGHRHVERRMMSLLCDAVLDMISSIGVSFWIFATYSPQFNDRFTASQGQTGLMTCGSRMSSKSSK
jgi:hypothetical protein